MTISSSDPPPAPLGEPVRFRPVPRPQRQTSTGRYVALLPLDAERDAEPLFEASHPPTGDPAIWTYLFDGPYRDLEEMRAALRAQERSADRMFFTLVPVAGGRASGVASYLRIVPEFGVIEIGNIWFGPALQRTAAATEAIYVLARHVFDDLGYRRLEWKCNALNFDPAGRQRRSLAELRGHRLPEPT